MKSDIWSTACILIELYTGEMFFSTHENVEHLAMMEKAFGPFPRHMAERSFSSFRDLFNLSSPEEQIKRKGHRLNWPHVSKKRESFRNVEEMLPLNVRLPTSNNPRKSSNARITLTTRLFKPSWATCLNWTLQWGQQHSNALITRSFQGTSLKMRRRRRSESQMMPTSADKKVSQRRKLTSRTFQRLKARQGKSAEWALIHA